MRHPYAALVLAACLAGCSTYPSDEYVIIDRPVLDQSGAPVIGADGAPEMVPIVESRPAVNEDGTLETHQAVDPEKVAGVVTALTPFLPPPFNSLVPAVGGLLVLLFGSRRS